jgi:protein sidekick
MIFLFEFRITQINNAFPQSDSVSVDTSGRIQVLDSGDLLISNVRESDAGLYSCLRSNEAGSVNGEAYLGVMGK